MIQHKQRKKRVFFLILLNEYRKLLKWRNGIIENLMKTLKI